MSTRSMETPFSWNAGSPLEWLTKLGTGMLSFFAQFGDPPGGSSGGGYQAQSSGTDDPEGKFFKKKDKDYQPVPSGGKPPDPLPACCAVFYPNGPYCNWTGTPANYTCPDGWYRQWWFCCEGTRQAGCAECTRSQSTCWQGPWQCSTWWITTNPC